MRRGAWIVGVVVAWCAWTDAAWGLPRLHVDGGWMRDGEGRAVLLRGVNFPAGLRTADAVDRPVQAGIEEQAAKVAQLGFNVARLQITWGAMEPGRLPSNHPDVCAPGAPKDPGQWDEAHAQRYLDRVEAVVDALARHGVYSLFQISQYGYNVQFGGPPSHPDWAVCTDGLPITKAKGPLVYAQPAMARAAQHFWENDVVGDLQGEYGRMLEAIAARFADEPAIAGLELYNEPFGLTAPLADGQFDSLVQCFYLGAHDPGRLDTGDRPACPPGVAPRGVLRRVRDRAPGVVVHPQAHIFTNFGIQTRMGPLGVGDLVFNFHVYCISGIGQQVPDAYRGPECEDGERTAIEEADRVRRAMASPAQPGALGWFLSEFGFSDNAGTIRHVTELADRHLLGWAYFTWRNDDGPDNSGVLREQDGSLRPKIKLLARPYPAATAGEPQELRYDPDRRTLRFRFDAVASGRTTVVLPDTAYGADGACPVLDRGTWAIYGDRLTIRVADRGPVTLTVKPGRCGRRSAPCASRRVIPVKVPARLGRRVGATLDGRRVAVRRRGVQRSVVVDLRGRPPGTARLVLTGRASDGRLRSVTRRYRTCRPSN